MQILPEGNVASDFALVDKIIRLKRASCAATGDVPRRELHLPVMCAYQHCPHNFQAQRGCLLSSPLKIDVQRLEKKVHSNDKNKVVYFD